MLAQNPTADLQFAILTQVLRFARFGDWPFAPEVPTQAAMLHDSPQL